MADFDFNQLLQDPSFMFGAQILGNRGPDRMAQAMQAMQQMALVKQQKEELTQKKLLNESQIMENKSQAGKRQFDIQRQLQQQQMFAKLLKEQYGIEMPVGQDQPQQPTEPAPSQGMTPPSLGGLQPNPFNGMPPADTDQVSGTPNAAQAGMQPIGLSSTGAQQPQANRYNAVPPESLMWDMAGHPELAKIAADRTKDVVTRDGAVLRLQPDGGYKMVKGSLEGAQAIERMRETTKAEQDPTVLSLDNGEKVEVTRLQKAAFLNSGVLPPAIAQRMAGDRRQSESDNTPAIAGNNYGNMRPAGASEGFQSFGTPEEGIGAIDKQLKLYGARGINTLSKIISTWAPPNENDTPALIANAAKRLGIKADAVLDMNNPAARQLVSSAIMLQEHGSKALLAASSEPSQKAAPRIGFQQAPDMAAQANVRAEGWGKEEITMRQAARAAGGKVANMKMLLGYLDKIPRSGLAAPVEQGFGKIAAAAGFKVSPKIAIMEAAGSIAKQMAMEMRDTSQGGGMPGQMSNYEDRLLQTMVPNIGKLPLSNKLIGLGYIAKQERLQRIHKIMSAYVKTHGKLDEGVDAEIEADKDQSDKVLTAKVEAITGMPIEKYVAQEVKAKGHDTGNLPITGPGTPAPKGHPLDQFWKN